MPRRTRTRNGGSGDAARQRGKRTLLGTIRVARWGMRFAIPAVGLSLAIGLLVHVPAHAATITWTGLGATTNWNLAANWSTNTVPGAGDVAVFDATSSKPAVINANVNVNGLTIGAGYAGSVTQAAARTITVGATGWSQAASTFTGSAAAVTINGPFLLTGGTFTSTSGTLSVAGNLTDATGAFAPNGGTLRLIGAAAAIDVAGSLTVWNLTLAQANATPKTLDPADTLVVAGTLTLTNGTWEGGTLAARGPIAATSGFDGGDGILRIDGTADQVVTGSATLTAGSLPDVVIDKASGVLTLNGTIRVANGSWTYLGGTLDPDGSTVAFDNGSLIAGSHTLAAVVVRGTGASLAPADTLTASGLLSLANGTWDGGTLLAAGDLTQAAAFDGGDGTLRIGGSGPQLFTGSATVSTGQLPAVVIDKPAGTLSLAGTIRTTHDWTYVGGALDPDTSTVVFAGALAINGTVALHHAQVRVATITLAGTLTLGGNLTVASGTLDLDGNSVTVAGDVTVAGTLLAPGATILVGGGVLVTGALVADGGVLVMQGTGVQHLDTDGAPLGDLVVDGMVGVILDADLDVRGTLDLASGTLVVGPHRLRIEHAIAGIDTALVADATSSLSVGGSTSGIRVPASVTDLADLSIETDAGVGLSVSLTLHVGLVLDGGNLDASGLLVRLIPGAVVSRTSGHVIGTLEKPIPAGGPVVVEFEIGDGSGYTPLVASWEAVSAAGALAVSTAAGDDATGLVAVGLVPSASVNRTWTLASSGLSADPVEIAVTYLPTDLDPLAVPTSLLAVLTDAGGPGLIAVGQRDALGLSSSLTGAPTGRLALGMPGADVGVTIDGPTTAQVLQSMSWTIQAQNLGAFAAVTSLTIVADAGTVIADVVPSQGTCSTGGLMVTCQLGVLGPGSTASVTLDASMDRAGAHQLTAALSTDGATVDAVLGNDIAILLVTVSPALSASPTPSASPAPSAGGLPDTAGSTGALIGVATLALIVVASAAVVGLGRSRRRSL